MFRIISNKKYQNDLQKAYHEGFEDGSTFRETTRESIDKAYAALDKVINRKKVTKAELTTAIEEAIGFIRETSDD